MSESDPAAMTTRGFAPEAISAKGLLPIVPAPASMDFPVSFASADSSFVIFSAMLASKLSYTSLFLFAKACAANFATLAGLQMKAFEDPGGFVKQVLFMPSGGQETTGKLDKYDAVPDSASVPPAQPTSMTGL